jgi:hypothetical protein
MVDNILNMHRQLFRARHKNGCDACLICSLKESLLNIIFYNGHLVKNYLLVIIYLIGRLK